MKYGEKSLKQNFQFDGRNIFKLLLISVFAIGLTAEVTAAEKINIDFADIPGNGSTVKPFKMSKTEVTMLQYVTFLNAALRAKQITVGKVESVDEEQARLSPRKKLGPRFLAFKASKQQFVLDKAGNRLIDLYGMRVTGVSCPPITEPLVV